MCPTQRPHAAGRTQRPAGHPTRRRTRALAAVVGIAAVWGIADLARAQFFTWTGGGDGVNFGDGANWQGGATPGYGTLVFGTAGAGSLNQNLGNPLSMHRIDFTGAAAYTLGGSQVNFFDFGGQQARIENQSSVAQTIDFAVNFAATTGNNWAELNPVNGDLRVGAVSVTGSAVNSLQVFGSNGFTLTFGGILSGAGKELVINNASNVAFEAANTYSGDTFVNAGTLQFRSGGSAASTTLRIGNTSGTAPATLSLVNATGGQSLGNTIVVRPGSSGAKTIKSTNTSGTNTLSGNVFLDADVTVSSDNAGGTLALTGTTIDLKNQTMTLTGSGDTTISGNLQNPTVGETGKLTKSGTGVLTLSGTNTYRGATTINGGTVSIATDSNLGAVPSGATAGHLTLNGGTLRHNAASLGGVNSFLAANRGIALGSSGGTIEVTVPTAVLTYDNGQITGSGNTLTKTGPGAFRLVTPSAITFSKLVVKGGAYQGGADSHYGAVPGAFLSDAITLDGGGLGVTAGLTLVANRGVTLGPSGGVFSHTSALGVAGVISGTQGGGITKRGTGVLTLSAVNTYDGPTTLEAGVASLSASTSTLGNGVGTLQLNGGTLSAGANKSGANAIPNPVELLGNSTVAASATRTIEFSSNSLTTTSGQLTIANTGTGTTSLRVSGSGFNFSRPIVFNNTGTGTVELAVWNATGIQEFSGIISGSGTLRRSISSGSAGTTIFSAANTYNGNTTLNEGFVGFGASTAPATGAITSGPIGTGALVFNAGLIGVFAHNGSRVVRNPVTVNQSFTIGGVHDLELAGDVGIGSGARTITVSNLGLTVLSGVINGSGSLTKGGGGALRVIGSNIYTGGTTVSAGTFLASNTTGSATGSGSVNVSSTATLGGTGFIAGAVNINAGAALAPGESIGDLDTGSLTFAGPTSQFLIEINADTPAADRVNVAGAVALGGAAVQLKFVTITPGLHTTPQTFVLVNNDAADAVSGTFGTVTAPPWASIVMDYAYAGTDSTGFSADGNDVAITITYTPEPSGLALAAGAAGMLLRRRRDS